jgi:peptidoglycan/xylan/chitin deacetylase (PgdA/CDA1 family)
MKQTIIQEVPMTRIERVVAVGFKLSGITRLLMKYRKDHLTILAYHHVYNDDHHDRQEVTNPFFIGLKRFTEHLEYLKEDFHPVGVNDILAWIEGKDKLPERSLLLTFDDGYKGFYREVYPVLKRLGIPALVNLITGWVDEEVTPWDVLINRGVSNAFTNRLVLNIEGEEIILLLDTLDKKREAFAFLSGLYETSSTRYREELLGGLIKAAPWIVENDGVLESLSWDEIRKMAGNGIDFGCHTYSHAILSGMTPVEIKEELLRSKKRMMDVLSMDDTVFTYPAGRYDSNVIEQVEEVGFRFAMNTEGKCLRYPGNRYLIPRISPRLDDTMAEFALKVSGLHATARGVYRKIPVKNGGGLFWVL